MTVRLALDALVAFAAYYALAWALDRIGTWRQRR